MEYLICFDDIHNFWLPKNLYQKLWRQEYLNFKLPLEYVDTNNICYEKVSGPMSYWANITARNRIDVRRGKKYFETREENIKILDEYLTFCEKNSIRPIMFLSPFSEGYKKYFNRFLLDEFYYLVEKALKKHKTARFFDGWKLEGFSDEYFGDVDHLNRKGAAKFSELFNEFILNLEAGEK